MNASDHLLAIEQIKQLKARYFRCMDTKDWAGLRSVFCDDAVFDARASLSLDGTGDDPSSESNDWIYHGGNLIADFVRETVSSLRTVHHGHCHEVEILSETEARGVIAMEDKVWDLASGAPTLHGCGHYHETYRKDAGAWRILNSKITRLYVKVG
jgi:hypothetical protein